MKTTTLSTRKSSLYILVGFFSLILTSCSSYQNSSYHDNDGIYSTNGSKNVTSSNQPTPSSLQYKQYFESLQNTSGTDDEIFTDVNSYSSGGYNTNNDSIQAPSTGYASWGSSPQETTVTVYPDSYWSIGFGWGYPYYGYPYYPYYPYYGWGYPGYGWGYPGYGWGGYPGYGHGHPIVTPYAYNHSRRGSSYGGGYTNRVTPYNRNSVTNRNNIYNRNNVYSRNNAYSTNRNSTNNIVNRKAPTFTNRNNVSTSNSRNYNQSQSRSNSNYTQSRNTNSTQRSYTPSNSSYRSSGSNMSGGGRTSGGGVGGGGRMGGGRR